MQIPIALKIAFVTAGPITGVLGSPAPPGLYTEAKQKLIDMTVKWF